MKRNVTAINSVDHEIRSKDNDDRDSKVVSSRRPCEDQSKSLGVF